MAILDPRLLELIETSAAARLDWLAFELIEGVQAGRPSEEPEAALGGALKQFETSIDTLDFLVEGTTEHPAKTGAVAQPADVSKQSAVAVLLDLESERNSGREDVVAARASLPTLRIALTEWVAQARGQATT